MDILEQRGHVGLRHPWEHARLSFVQRVLERTDCAGRNALDVGCGDGFVLSQLASRFGFNRALGVDLHLSAELCRSMSQGALEFRATLPTAPTPDFDLLLLLDVLEHVEQPVPFLASLCEQHLRTGAAVLITVPAFGELYSKHDLELRHFRRYHRSQVAAEAQRAGLTVVDSGYFFASLLAPRAASVLKQRLASGPPLVWDATRPSAREAATHDPVGLGAWRGGALSSWAVARALALDAQLCFWLSRQGLRLPGLSAWALCRK